MSMDHQRGRPILQGSHKGKGIAVFTSGGDSQGKNFVKKIIGAAVILVSNVDDFCMNYESHLRHSQADVMCIGVLAIFW